VCFVQNDVPLKTIDGGSTWVPLDSTPAKISKFGARDAAHPLGALSWSGKTLVVSGADQSAIGRQERVSLACIHYVRLQSVTAVGPRLHLSACLVEYSAWADETLLMCMQSSAVFKSTDDGATWTDETGDIVTVSMGHGYWYEKDYYLVTSGEGIIVRRNFEL
jgi:hypothetical protein